jgi:hypothetical protein
MTITGWHGNDWRGYEAVDGSPPGRRDPSSSAGRYSHPPLQEVSAMTRAQEVFEKVNALTDGGMSRPDSFKQVASELSIQVNSARGSYYAYSRGATGNGKSRTRKRETTAADALADARATLERSLEAIDRECEAAKERAAEAAAEYEAMRGSAKARKEAIKAKIAALEA